MNIFYLSNNTKECAQMHCDKHVVKMITETAQLLCSAYYFTNQQQVSPYRLTHKNHPCSIWTRESLDNWLWLKDLGIELYNEYKHRYGQHKIHKAGEVILSLVNPDLISNGFTEPCECMDDEFKVDSVIESYMNYYKYKSKTIDFRFTNREVPKFIIA